MASEHHSQSKVELYESGLTVPSDSENYSAHQDLSSSSSSSPLILYQPPTLWSLLRGAAINLFLPFVNGLMLGFGELFAHEAAFRLGWSGTKVRSMRMDVLGGDHPCWVGPPEGQLLINRWLLLSTDFPYLSTVSSPRAWGGSAGSTLAERQSCRSGLSGRGPVAIEKIPTILSFRGGLATACDFFGLYTLHWNGLIHDSLLLWICYGCA